MRRHLDILDELESITEHDGFVETCLELRDSMLFYDRNLVIAGCSGTIELLAALGMFWSCLESDKEAERTFAAIEAIFDDLPNRLIDPSSPIDVQALVDSFLQTGGWVLKNRVVVLEAMFRFYVYDEYDVSTNVDALLKDAASALMQDREEEAIFNYAQAGTLGLRGAHIRPVWLEISPPMGQIWLKGILNVISNFRTAPNFSFPLDEVEAERRKWQGCDSRVVDLKAFRNGRYPSSRFKASEFEFRDRVDEILDRVFIDNSDLTLFLDGLTDEAIADLRSALEPILLVILEGAREKASQDSLRENTVMQTIRLVGELRIERAIDGLIGIVERAGPGEPALAESITALRNMGQHATARILDYVRTTPDLGTAAVLAEVLGHASPGEDVFAALKELFEKLDWSGHRDLVALAFADYGDPRAIPLLKKALSDGERATTDQKNEIRWALRELLRKTRNSHGNRSSSASEEAGKCR